MGVNYDSIKKSLRTESTTLTIRHYSGTTPQFDSDQNPLNTFVDTSTEALVLEPTKTDKEYLGGLLTEHTRKCVFNKDETVQVSDDIFWNAGTFQAFEVQPLITRTVVFINRKPNSD